MSTAALCRMPPLPVSVRDKPRLEHFGPATITAVLDQEVELEMPGDVSGIRQWARLAVASGYRPQIGDVMLAIATADDCYVIGVLEGRGPTVLDAPGDLELRASRGAIRIVAADGCIVAAPTVRVAANEIDLVGNTLREEFETVRRRISGMLEVRAKAICTAVAETYRLAAQRIIGRGEDSVTIDAPSINLG
jgi:hypothetical protein